jgi:hypothetical protein
MVFWNAIAGAVQGTIGSDAFNAAVDANNRISSTNAKARNSVRQASNLATAAQNSLARWIQSLNNNRMLDAGGAQLEASIVNYRRSNDAFVTQGFSESIRQAEQAGAAAAAQAAAGIEGNVVDMVNGSTKLRDSIVNQQMEDMGLLQASDAAKRAGDILTSTVQGLDGSIIIDMLDYNIDVPTTQVKFSKFQNAMFGMIKHMGGVSSDPNEKPQEKPQSAENDWNTRTSTIKFGDDAGTGGRSLSDDHNITANNSNARWSWEKDKDEDPYSLWGSRTDSGTGDSSGGNSYFSF